MAQRWENDKKRQGLSSWVAGVPGYLYQTLGIEREIGIPEQDRNPLDRADKQRVRQRNN